jgi:tRNA(Arg) A34 adenosine deaminase TadA
MCLSACYWARVDEIYYASTREDAAAAGFDDALLHEEVRLPLGARRLPMTRIAVAAGVTLFEAWSNKLDRVRY